MAFSFTGATGEVRAGIANRPSNRVRMALRPGRWRIGQASNAADFKGMVSPARRSKRRRHALGLFGMRAIGALTCHKTA